MQSMAGRLTGGKKMVSMRLNLKPVNTVKRLLKVKDRTEAVEKALSEVSEREKFCKYIEKTSGKLKIEGFLERIGDSGHLQDNP